MSLKSVVLVGLVACSAKADSKVTLASLVPSPHHAVVHEGEISFEVDDIPALMTALSADKPVLDATPRCMTPQSIEFDDAAGKPLGTVGFCDGASGTGGYDQTAVFIDAKHVARYGLAPADAAAVGKILAPYREKSISPRARS